MVLWRNEQWETLFTKFVIPPFDANQYVDNYTTNQITKNTKTELTKAPLVDFGITILGAIKIILHLA